MIVGCIAQCIGPVRQMHQNSKYYSAVKSPRLTNRILPHVTIQCPVYKEGLASVIAPTVKSIKQAISTYELQGGSANMLINDDGIQLIPDDERQARIDFYADHSIGWTARPKHNLMLPNGSKFTRKGKFKKVSGLSIVLVDEPIRVLLFCIVISTSVAVVRSHGRCFALHGAGYGTIATPPDSTLPVLPNQRFCSRRPPDRLG